MGLRWPCPGVSEFMIDGDRGATGDVLPGAICNHSSAYPRSLVSQAEAFFVRHGVREPERYVAMVMPGVEMP